MLKQDMSCFFENLHVPLVEKKEDIIQIRDFD